MKVRAKMLGYYKNKRRYEGQMFDIKGEEEYSEAWMEKVEGKAKAEPKAKAKPKAKKEAVDLAEKVI